LDVDLDSQQTKRPQILQALKNYYGSDNVLNIITFGTEKSKSALLTAVRGLEYDVDIGQYLSSMIPVERGFQRPLHDCVFGNSEKGLKPVHSLVSELKKYPKVQEVALAIEGLINKRSVHASGVYIYNNGFLEKSGCMRAPSGQLVTCWDMDDADYAGSLKFDMLTIENLDRIRVTMNLLLEDGLMEWQNSLKATYDKYLHPDVLDCETPGMWEMIGRGEVISLFQFSTSIIDLVA